MLDGTLREILPLGDALRLAPPFDDRAGNAALPELDGERNADRPAADDDDLVSLAHDCQSGSVIAGAAKGDCLVASLIATTALLPQQQNRIGRFRHPLPGIGVVFYELPALPARRQQH